MHVIAIYGESGTGKSSSALAFAHEKSIEAIIDDGLLIHNGKIIAGLSAKFEKNTLTAVKRAIFSDEHHAKLVREKIVEGHFESILIIGTSIKMVDRIAERLQIAPIDSYVKIESIRSEEEIRLAKYIREINGKHTMPLPHSEVEQNFFKRMIQKGRDIFSSKREKIGETTLVSPDFHPQTIFVDSKVYDQVIHYVVSSHHAIKHVHRITFRFTDHLPILIVEVSIKAPVTYNVWDEMNGVQHEIQHAFEQMFHLKLSTIQLNIKSIQK
jgi:adenylate kinase family enzyme